MVAVGVGVYVTTVVDVELPNVKVMHVVVPALGSVFVVKNWGRALAQLTEAKVTTADTTESFIFIERGHASPGPVNVGVSSNTYRPGPQATAVHRGGEDFPS